MGLNIDTNGGSGNYLCVKHGCLCLESKTEKEGYEMIMVPNPSNGGKEQPKWIKRFKSVDGFIRGAEWYDREFDGTPFQGVKLKLEDDGEYYTLDLPYGSKAFDAFTKFAEDIDLDQKIEFFASTKKEGTKDVLIFYATQGGSVIRQRYTKADPGDSPEPKYNQRTKKWDFTERNDWLLSKLLDETLPRIKEATNFPEPEYTGDEVQHVAPKKRKAVKAGASSQTDVENWQDAEAAF